MDEDIFPIQQDFYKRLKIKGLGENTLKNYKTDLNCFNDYLRDNGDHRFDISWAQDYGDFLEKKYRADNSKRRRLQSLRIFFDYLVERNLVPTNPLRALVSAPKFLDIPRPTPPSAVSLLWENLNRKPESTLPVPVLSSLRDQLLFLLVYSSGLTVSQMGTLDLDHILMGKRPRVLVTPKKRDPYSVPLSPLFTDIFRPYKILLARMKKEGGFSFGELFFNANPFKILSGGLSPRGIEIIFKRWQSQWDIGVTPRALRQACIFLWIQQGHGDGIIREWLGLSPHYSLGLYREHVSRYRYRALEPLSS